MTVKGACEGDMRVMELFCVLIVMVVTVFECFTVCDAVGPCSRAGRRVSL